MATPGSTIMINCWSFVNEIPTRRGCAQHGLARLWMIPDALIQCDCLVQRAHIRLLEFISRISRGETRLQVGKKKKPISMLEKRVLLTLQACEVVMKCL